MMGVYKITNIQNGKIYVGSAVDIKTRWRKHRTELNCQRHVNPKLQRAWNKYGSGAFSFVVLEQVDNKDTLLQSEQKWLDQLKATETGYNVLPTAGSPLGIKVSDETKLKLSQAKIGENNPFFGKTHTSEERMRMSQRRIGNQYRKGIPHSDEIKQQISTSLKGEKNHFFGRKHSEESKEKMRISQTGKKHSKESREKMSLARKGQIKSSETRIRMSLAQQKRRASESSFMGAVR